MPFRAIVIFATYILFALTLVGRSISIIFQQKAKNKVTPEQSKGFKIVAFCLLAAASIASTWYHMIRFFAQSYHEWAMKQVAVNVIDLSLDRWLSETLLFKQAYQKVTSTAPAYWWSHQVFSFAALWTAFLGIEGSRRGIPDLWIFVILGQLVAVSFAANLSILAILFSPIKGRSKEKPPLSDIPPRLSLTAKLVAILTAGLPALIPIYQHNITVWWIAILVPHAFCFVPVIVQCIPPRLRQTSGLRSLIDPGNAKRLYQTITIVLLAQLTWASVLVHLEGDTPLSVIMAFSSHPAISSVGWDVVHCWFSLALLSMDHFEITAV